MKTLVILADGRQLSSGEPGADAIRSFTLTQCVNENQELTVGSVCSAMVELQLFSTGQELLIPAGQEFTVYRQDNSGTVHKVGIFLAQQESRPTQGSMKIVAYDRICRLDQDLTQWFGALEQWPYSLQQLAQLVCQACGLTMVQTQLPNGEYMVPKFYAQGVTGRHLLSWIGELCGRFCRCNADGQVEFAWYRENPVVVGTGEYFCYQKGMAVEDYATAPIDRVVLRQNDSDLGTAYPEQTGGENAYVITGNPMAVANSASTLIGLAQTLYEQLRQVSYTPCRLELPGSFDVLAGDIVTVQVNGERTVTAYIMTKKQSSGRDSLRCTGSPNRNSATALQELNYGTLTGRVMNLSMSVDGLRLENQQAQERAASLSLEVGGINLEVSRQQQQMDQLKEQLTAIRQTEEAVQIQISTLTQEGADKVTTRSGFTFDENGLTISKSDSQMVNRLDESGMYVTRGGQTLLQADQEGVTAVDVSVKNFLIMGEHARFEDYSGTEDENRTACFWI